METLWTAWLFLRNAAPKSEIFTLGRCVYGDIKAAQE